MKPKFLLCLALVLSGGLFGCSTVVSHRSLPNYEAELRYWRELPYPRVEKLMNVYDGDMADKTYVSLDENRYLGNDVVDTNNFNENDYAVVIEYHRAVDGTPDVNEIYKSKVTPEGKITRKAKISVLGQLEFEEEYLNGKRHGNWYTWYPNGKIRFVQSYTNDQPDGVWRDFSPKGKVIQKQIYHNGKLLEAWGVGVGGKWEKCVNKGNGYISDFGEDGQLDGGWDVIDGEIGRGEH
jgi:MORN repeat variant